MTIEERRTKDRDAATAWYNIKGCMIATDAYDKSLCTIYGEPYPEELPAKRLENYEAALKTLRVLIAIHAPDIK